VSKSSFYFKLILFLALAVAWADAIDFLRTSGMTPLLISIYGLATAVINFVMLDALDYFGSFDPVPGTDSFLTLLLSIPFSAFISKYFFLAAFEIIPLRYRDALVLSPFITVFVFCAHFLASFVFGKSGTKRKICYLTTPEEQHKVNQALRSRKLLRYYEPLTVSESDLRVLQPELACVVISRTELHRFEHREDVIEAMVSGKEILDYKEMIARVRGHVDLDSLDLWAFLSQTERRKTMGRIYHSSKTVLERVLAVLLLLLLSPIMVLTCIAVKITSPGPILYGQTRLGFRGEKFLVLKFRSMRRDAENQGPKLSTLHDPRITALGNFLRKTRIDELPQLWNILRGNMSLIGPRPERPEFYDELEKVIPLFRFRLLVRPGITGWAQVMGGYAATVPQMKRKLEYDLFYLQKMSPKMDFSIAVRTIAVALQAFIAR
jgi:lipopolysaccharide/colanic/teichoic acid biosynthesis glycosyltransferase